MSQHPLRAALSSGVVTMVRAVLYLRVSTDGQTVENQRRELLATAEHRGWTIVGEYCDHGISGAKGRDKRPELDRMLKDAARRRFDLVAFWSVDRLGRSTATVAPIMDEQLGLKQFYHKEAIDGSTAHGRAMLQMAAVFGELERAMIKERVKAGIDRVKAEGRTWTAAAMAGKVKGPSGRKPLDKGKRQAIVDARASGLSIRAAAAKCGVSPTTIQAVIRDSA